LGHAGKQRNEKNKNKNHRSALCLRKEKERENATTKRKGKPTCIGASPSHVWSYVFFLRRELGFEIKREEQKKKKNK